MTRAAKQLDIVFWEEPEWLETNPVSSARLIQKRDSSGVRIATPVLPADLSKGGATHAVAAVLDQFVEANVLSDPLLWYYTPAALEFSRHLAQRCPVIYDCMDELSAFLDADPALPQQEKELLGRARIVFTGGYSLFESKRRQHPNIHPFPSGVDVAHFRPARNALPEPADQAWIPHPRLGFFGVIDERMNTQLLGQLAAMRPDWHIVLIGPFAKISQAGLPRNGNIHYLGGKAYSELPAYLSGWDIALIPFALNDATRFISPTKTPEYLAGGKPVVSTPVTDIVRQFGGFPGVRIAGSAEAFAAAIESELRSARDHPAWLAQVDELLQRASWDGIWSRMAGLLGQINARGGTLEGVNLLLTES